MDTRITYHDLREEAERGRLAPVIGRRGEMRRLDRMLTRRATGNALLVGESGTGKTALAHAWMRRLSAREEHSAFALLEFDAGHLAALEEDTEAEARYVQALEQLPGSCLFIDDFGRAVYRNESLPPRIFRLYRPLFSRSDVHIVLTMTPQEHAWLSREFPALLQSFETIMLKSQSSFELERILAQKLPLLNANRLIVPQETLHEAVSLCARYPSVGSLPRAALRVLDESLALAAARGEKLLEPARVAEAVAAKTGIPSARLKLSELDEVERLEEELNARVLDQRSAIGKIAKTITRAKLGLRNPDRPLGSFLLLGPSGVGKTETAKALAELLFGRPESFVRFDMSEFAQEHAAQRLIGSPPGYVGHEAGGALTGALMREPHALVLLDEIEKAHPKVFDIFLQVLDDGRLTSGKNETVDARGAVIMATSNLATREILDAFAKDEALDEKTLLSRTVLPLLERTFRLEFLNRFDAILLFKPLPVASLLSIAQLEIRKVESRLAAHHVRFGIEPAVLERRISALADPRFGARPVKRFIEETCETLLAESLIATRSC